MGHVARTLEHLAAVLVLIGFLIPAIRHAYWREEFGDIPMLIIGSGWAVEAIVRQEEQPICPPDPDWHRQD